MMSRRLMRRVLWPATLLFALAAPLVLSSAALAHAIILSSTPAPNAQVAKGPIDIALQYNSLIDTGHSRISLVDPAGKVTALTASDGAAPGVLAAHGSTDSPGRWIIRWQVLSVDGHITRGEIPFQVIAAP